MVDLEQQAKRLDIGEVPLHLLDLLNQSIQRFRALHEAAVLLKFALQTLQEKSLRNIEGRQRGWNSITGRVETQVCCDVDGVGLCVLLEWLACSRRTAHLLVCYRTGTRALAQPNGRMVPMWFEQLDGNLSIVQ